MYYILKTASFLISLVPLKFLYGFAGSLYRIIFFFLPGKRANIYNNYKTVFEYSGEEPDKKRINKNMWQNIYNYGKFSVEFLYINKMIRKKMLDLEIQGAEHIKEGLSRGRGVIMCTLHFGNWDIAGIMAAHNFKPCWAIADDLGGGYSRFVQETRGSYGINVILPNKNLKDAYRALSENNMLNVLIDRPAPESDKKSVIVDFFGKKARVAASAQRLAIKTGAAVVVGATIRMPGGFKAVSGPVIEYDITGDNEKDVQDR